MCLPTAVNVFDVGCRDGFQLEKQFIPTDEKLAIVNRLAQLGFRKLEITSFVSPRAVPQMQDAELVVAGAERVAGVTYAALVPNTKGAQRALKAGIDELNVVFSVSESNNRANLQMSVDDSLKNVADIISLAQERGGKPVNVTLATSFGCPFEGEVPRERVLKLAREALSMGAASLSFADTTGMANPRQVYELLNVFREQFPDVQVTLHFHNTRAMGMANILAGLQAGVTSFDAALGGLGGCPFSPGASGNVATEDVVHMLEEMGISTGIDLDGLLAAARYLQKVIGRTLPGKIMKAGKVKDLHPLVC